MYFITCILLQCSAIFMKILFNETVAVIKSVFVRLTLVSK